MRGFLWAALVLLAIGFAPRASVAAPMTFRMAPDVGVQKAYRQTLGNGRHRIYAEGEIEADSAAKLVRFARDRQVQRAVVVLSSRGGSLLGGIRLGEAIRVEQFDTSVGEEIDDFERENPAVCASACAYAFAGGVNRYLPSGSLIGVHQFYGAGDNIGDRGETQAVSAILVEYLTRMGVDSSAFVIASKAPSDTMTWLLKDRAVELRLANQGAQPTTAEIKLADDMTPYLRLEQIKADGTARVLLLCGSRGIALAAGVVTDPEISLRREASAERSYLELDGVELLAMAGGSGVNARDSTLWWDRGIPFEFGSEIAKSNEIAMWLENGSNIRWGLEMDLRPVKSQLVSFTSNCLRRAKH